MKMLPLLPPFLIHLEKPLNGSVIGLLDILGEEATGKLAFIPGVPDTFTALSPPAAGFVSASARLLVIVYNTIHLKCFSLRIYKNLMKMNYTGTRGIDQGYIVFYGRKSLRARGLISLTPMPAIV
jgi:hypothetical protein